MITFDPSHLAVYLAPLFLAFKMSSPVKPRRTWTELASLAMGSVVGGVFILFWSSITLGFDGVLLYGIGMQLWSYTYAETEGTILKSDVDSDSSGDDTTYDLDINYQYVVDGRVFRGDKYRHQSVNTQGDWATPIAKQFPVDSRRSVFYNRARPDQAVLLRGIEGADLYLALFLTPFNMIMLAGWAVAYYTVFPRPKLAETGGVRVRDDGVTVRAFVPDQSALFVAALAIGGTSFVMIFLVGCLTGMRPTMPVMIGAWGVILGTAIWFGGQRYARDRAGHSDLVIDRFGQRLTLPVTHGRKEPLDVPFSAVERITVKEERKIDSEGDATYVYAVMLRERGHSATEQRIFDSSEQDKAQQFLTWFRTTLGVAPDVQPSAKKRKKRNRG